MSKGSTQQKADGSVHKLIDRLCQAFSETSPDVDHPAVRYGLQLQALRAKLGGIATAANSPTGGGTVPLPPTADEDYSDTQERDRARDGERSRGERDGPESFSLPAPAQPSATPISFPYASPGYPYGFVAPPHEQPLSEISSLQIGVDQNLGFATLDDWFPLGVGAALGGGSGSASAGATNNGGPLPGAGPAGNPFEALDLADFWVKVGPGEAQGGFPFR